MSSFGWFATNGGEAVCGHFVVCAAVWDIGDAFKFECAVRFGADVCRTGMVARHGLMSVRR